MIVTVKFKLVHTCDDYVDINVEFLLEDMLDKMECLKSGIEPSEIEHIEINND